MAGGLGWPEGGEDGGKVCCHQTVWKSVAEWPAAVSHSRRVKRWWNGRRRRYSPGRTGDPSRWACGRTGTARSGVSPGWMGGGEEEGGGRRCCRSRSRSQVCSVPWFAPELILKSLPSTVDSSFLQRSIFLQRILDEFLRRSGFSCYEWRLIRLPLHRKQLIY